MYNYVVVVIGHAGLRRGPTSIRHLGTQSAPRAGLEKVVELKLERTGPASNFPARLELGLDAGRGCYVRNKRRWSVRDLKQVTS